MQPDLSGLEDWELGALIQAIHEGRFPEGENDPVVWLSPFVIDLHVAAVTEQRRRVPERIDGRALRGEAPGHHAETYERWARWRGRREHDVVKRRLDGSHDLRRWFAGLDKEEIRNLFRPFTVDDASADDLLAYAARSGRYLPGGVEDGAEARVARARPYVRGLPAIEMPEGFLDVYEVAVLLPGADRLSDLEVTGRPEDALRRRGIEDRDASDCVQNAQAASLRGLISWCGVGSDEEWSGS